MTSSVQSVAFNNSENWLGAGSKSGVVKVFDLEANRSKLATQGGGEEGREEEGGRTEKEGNKGRGGSGRNGRE
jgi:WD40 repeat protein